jgi:probable rRNA maturation factor
MASDPLTPREIEALTEAVAAHLNLPARPVTVSFVDEAGITGLNRSHRQKDRPTDVLSFPFEDDFPHGPGGEVIICPEVAARNATARGLEPRDELAMLVVHGTLHVYGMEDETDAGRDEMERHTRRILEDVWSEISE